MATLTETPPFASAGHRRGLRLFDPGGGRSLDEAVRSALEATSTYGSSECLVCGAAARPRGDGALECPSCQSTID